MSNLYAIGDIHGQRGMLDMLIEKVPLEKDDEIVFIGDYIDRGPDSRGVVDAVLEFKLNYPNTTCLRGNHEDMFLDYIKDEKKYPKGIFTMNGGIETLHSYRVWARPRCRRFIWIFSSPLAIAMSPAVFFLFTQGCSPVFRSMRRWIRI